MLNQKLIDEPVFSFYLSDSKQDRDGSEATFGGINYDRFIGDLTTIPLRRKASWEVELNAITFGDDSAELEDTGAILDTSTSLIALPSTLAELL